MMSFICFKIQKKVRNVSIFINIFFRRISAMVSQAIKATEPWPCEKRRRVQGGKCINPRSPVEGARALEMALQSARPQK